MSATDTKLENPARRRLFKGQVSSKNELRLPWVLDEQTFVDKCTQCGDCISQCPTEIITKDTLGYPKVDFAQDECTFCMKCVDTCQEPLFKQHVAREKDQAWPIQFAINDKCLAKNGIYCQSCRDCCQPQAITFSYQNSAIPTPNLDVDKCSQCGACQSVCPQQAINYSFNNHPINAA